MIKLDKWQQEVLDYDGDILLCTGRRVGKTYILARKAMDVYEREIFTDRTFSRPRNVHSRGFRSIFEGNVYARGESNRRGEIDKTSALDAQKPQRSNLSYFTAARNDDTKLQRKRANVRWIRVG